MSAAREAWNGFTRPFTLLLALRARPEAWRRFVRTVGAQVGSAVALAAVVLALGDSPTDKMAERRRVRAALRDTRVLVDGGLALVDGGAVEWSPALVKLFVADGARDGGTPGARARVDDEAITTDEAPDGEALGARINGEAVETADARDGVRLDKAVTADGGALGARLDAETIAADDAPHGARLDDEALAALEKELADEPRSLPAAWLALVFSALVAGQWVTLALSREYQEPIARDLCAVADIEPEDPERTPRVRLDFKWLRKKGLQRARGLLVLLPGFLVFTPVLLVTKVLGVDDYVMPPLMFSWTAYWWCAFTAGRSARAWRDADAGVPPLPVRWWLERTHRTPGFRWFLPRWAGTFALWATRRDAAPAVALERAPWAFVGLGLARLVTSPPILRLVFRAPVDMAVAELLERTSSVRPTERHQPEEPTVG